MNEKHVFQGSVKNTIGLLLCLSCVTFGGAEAVADVVEVDLQPGEQGTAGADFFSLQVVVTTDTTVLFRVTASRGNLVGVYASMGRTVVEATQLEWAVPGSDPLVVDFEVPRVDLAITFLYLMKDEGLLGTRYALALGTWFEALAAASPPLSVQAGTITMELCVVRGGQWQLVPPRLDRSEGVMTGEYYRCYFASPENGNVCSDSDECGRGRCWCTGSEIGDGVISPDSALDGTAGTGICDDDRELIDGFWYCLVEDGRIMVNGIIVD